MWYKNKSKASLVSSSTAIIFKFIYDWRLCSGNQIDYPSIQGLSSNTDQTIFNYYCRYKAEKHRELSMNSFLFTYVWSN